MFTGKGVGRWVSCLCDSEESVMTSEELDEVKVSWGHLTLILLPQLGGASRAERRSNLGEGMYYPNWGKVWEFEWDVEEQEKKKVILGFRQWAAPFMLPQWSCMRWDAFIVLMFFCFWELSFIWLQVSLILQPVYTKNYVKHKVLCNIMLCTCSIFWPLVMSSSPFPAQERNNSICLHHRGNRATKNSCGIRVMGQGERRLWEFDRWLYRGHIRTCTA